MEGVCCTIAITSYQFLTDAGSTFHFWLLQAEKLKVVLFLLWVTNCGYSHGGDEIHSVSVFCFFEHTV